MPEKKLNAKNLKDELWSVLQDLRNNKIEPTQAEAVASQSREIIRVLRTEQSILKQANRSVTEELVSFTAGN